MGNPVPSFILGPREKLGEDMARGLTPMEETRPLLEKK